MKMFLARAYSLRRNLLHLEERDVDRVVRLLEDAHLADQRDLELLLERVVDGGLVHLRHGRRRLAVEDDVSLRAPETKRGERLMRVRNRKELGCRVQANARSCANSGRAHR